MPNKPKRLPAAVKRYAAKFAAGEVGFKRHVQQQRVAYETMPNPVGDFAGWLALKLSCSRSDAETILRWSQDAE